MIETNVCDPSIESRQGSPSSQDQLSRHADRPLRTAPLSKDLHSRISITKERFSHPLAKHGGRDASETPGCRTAVVVHAGARDAYQLALGLSEAGLLEALVTDLFWPAEGNAFNRLLARVSPRWNEVLRRRSVQGLPFSRVRLCFVAGLRTFLLDNVPNVPFSWRRRSTRSADAALGRAAGRLAREKGAGLVTYSYTGFDSMRQFGRSAMLFQVHPHPATVRRLLREELALHPDCGDSLRQEWELALPESDFQHLVNESSMAQRYMVASSFTRDSLTEHGVCASAIKVIPYGVDLERFRPPADSQATRGKELRLLFVGRINQRKGIKYLLEALRLLDDIAVHLTICGRVVDDLELFRSFGSQIDIRPSVSPPELERAYQCADLFVFPSVAEGFGQVLLEALASGLPILSTTHTAAPDLIRNGEEGFIVEPRRPDLLAERIRWAATHRNELRAMGMAARARAEHFTWDRFRAEATGAVRQYLSERLSSGPE